MGLAEAVHDVIDLIRSQPGAGEAGDGWDLIVRTVTESDSMTDGEVKVIEKAIGEAYRGWSHAQRRSICKAASSRKTYVS